MITKNINEYNIINRYFFFATDKRKASEEFSMGDKQEWEGEASASESKSGEDQDESSAQPGVKEEPEVLEGPYSDWLKVDKAPEGQAEGQDDEEDDPDSDTEPDSEFDALRFDEELKEWVIADDLSSLKIQEDEIPPVSNRLFKAHIQIVTHLQFH